VVARWPHRAEGPVHVSGQHAFHGVDGRARRFQRGAIGPRARLGVRVEADRPAFARGDGGDVSVGVDAAELLGRGLPRRQGPKPRLEAGVAKAAPDGVQPLRPLRVPAPRVVLAEERIVVQRDARGAGYPFLLKCCLAASVSLGRISNTSPTSP
jgi:hypothetical protein